MSSVFDRLCAPGQPLRAEPPDATEFKGLLYSGRRRLADAGAPGMSVESRFDIVYNAAHSLCLAALRWNGYRSRHRYIVFQLLPHTLGLGPEVWRVLARCHELRNRCEYEGEQNVDERILADLVRACRAVEAAVLALAPLK